LTGTLTLNTEGNTNAVFDFEIGSTLTTASNSSVVFTSAGQTNNVFWQVGSSATLGTTTEFAGIILADASITLDTGANIQCGSALAMTGAVTMDANDVAVCQTTQTATSNAPEPGTLLFTMSLLPFLIVYVRQSWKRAERRKQSRLLDGGYDAQKRLNSPMLKG
jgi:Ice-binding-like